MTQDHSLHILCYLHFTMTKTKDLTIMTTILKDWKIREVLDILNVVYSKFYNPSEHMAIDELTVLFKEKGAFK